MIILLRMLNDKMSSAILTTVASTNCHLSERGKVEAALLKTALSVTACCSPFHCCSKGNEHCKKLAVNLNESYIFNTTVFQLNKKPNSTKLVVKTLLHKFSRGILAEMCLQWPWSLNLA